MSICWIGIGANIGSPMQSFDGAWNQLSDHPLIQCVVRSSIYQTAPIGAESGYTFTNAVFSLTTTLAPIQLLDVLQGVETTLGRTRDVRWGPRVLDLDLLFVDDQTICEPRLTLPHPAAWYRRFVLDPLVEICPTLWHPVLNQTIEQLHQRLQKRPLSFGCAVEVLSDAIAVLNQRAHSGRSVELIPLNESILDLDVMLRVNSFEPPMSLWNGIPVADLSKNPGSPKRRIEDFLGAVLDEPVRIGPW